MTETAPKPPDLTTVQYKRCRVCNHPDRNELELLILDRDVSNNRVAKSYGISASCISRHKRQHIDPNQILEPKNSRTKLPKNGQQSAYAKLALETGGRLIQRFIDELCADPNMAVGPAGERAGWDRNIATAKGHKVLERNEVKQALAERLRDRAARVEVRQDATLLEMQAIAYSDLGDVMEWGEIKVVVKGATVTLKASKDIPPEARRAIKSFRFDSKNRPSIEMMDKLPALKLLAAQAGMATSVVAEKVIVVVRDARTGKEIQAPVALPALPGDVARLEEEQAEKGARPVKRLAPGAMGPEGAIEVKAKEPPAKTDDPNCTPTGRDDSSYQKAKGPPIETGATLLATNRRKRTSDPHPTPKSL